MEKLFLLIVFNLIFFLNYSCAIKSENYINLQVEFASNEWTGVKIPKQGVCRREGGESLSPQLLIKNIPYEADSLIMEYTREDLRKNRYGQYGVFGYKINKGTNEIVVPSIRGGTTELPENFFLEPGKLNSLPGQVVYHPPCGGYWLNYIVNVTAVSHDVPPGQESIKLGKGSLMIGTY